MPMPKKRLTTKRMLDARFRRTETLILNTVYRSKGRLSVKQIAKRTGLAKSTFYVHHKGVHAVIPDFKRFVLTSYAKQIRGQQVIKRLYITTLFFILNHKQFFVFLTQNGDRDLLINMIKMASNKIKLSLNLPKNSRKILRVYSSEISELIVCWCEDGMPEDDIGQLLSDALFLTNTMRTRLIRFLD